MGNRYRATPVLLGNFGNRDFLGGSQNRQCVEYGPPRFPHILPMCRRDIGDYLGLTLETVSRALSQLSDQGVLVFSSARQIVLRNRRRLADMDA